MCDACVTCDVCVCCVMCALCEEQWTNLAISPCLLPCLWLLFTLQARRPVCKLLRNSPISYQHFTIGLPGIQTLPSVFELYMGSEDLNSGCQACERHPLNHLLRVQNFKTIKQMGSLVFWWLDIPAALVSFCQRDTN